MFAPRHHAGESQDRRSGRLHAKGSDAACRRYRTSLANRRWRQDGSRRAKSARIFMRATGFRTTNVPAAPMLTASKLSVFAITLGRNVLWPPTLTPLISTEPVPSFPQVMDRKSCRSDAQSVNRRIVARQDFAPDDCRNADHRPEHEDRAAPMDIPACETAVARRPSCGAARTPPRRRK